MKPVVFFFLAFFFLFLKDGSRVFAGTHHSAADRTHHNRAFAEVKRGSISDSKEALISIEDENEELVSARKYVLPVKYIFAFTYAAVLLLLCNSVKNRLPFCRHFSYIFSYKYILQRVLRL